MKTRFVPLGESYKALFAACSAGTQPDWLAVRRKGAIDRLRRDGLPTRQVEVWKYTDISPLAERALVLPARINSRSALPPNLPFWHEDDLNIVFVDGQFSPEQSSAVQSDEIQVVRLNDLATNPETAPSDMLASALMNAAFRRDGVLVRIPAHCQLERRIHFVLLHASKTPDAILAPWLAVVAEESAEARIAITALSISESPCLHVPRVFVSAAAGAQLAVSQSQLMNDQSWQLGTTRIEQHRDSRVTHLEAAVGAALARHDLAAVLLESGAEVELNGLYVQRNHRHVDFHTWIEHRQPNCRSRQVYKGIVDDHAAAVFNGAVRVHPGASGTDGYQLNRTLLMSRDAQVFSKPELLIDNDDVKCSHGATIGQISAQELFYLQSRGIPEAQARHMLSRAFVEDVLFRQKDARQRADLDILLDHYFPTGHD
ncbi:MAG: Fe-S cluster assembly protein SufD [Kiritimatiellia bacterium]|jgi:Fe-S cluster assembly protein SufD|nr:Fe-S cluster assembly protein SufD [Kiritimatiellia bacterium]